MNHHEEDRLEAIAEAIAFAHEADTAVLPDAPAHDVIELERVAALAAAAAAGSERPPQAVAARLAAAGLAFCAETRVRSDMGADTAAQDPTQGRPVAGFTTPTQQSSGRVIAFVLGAAAAGLLVWLGLTGTGGASLREMREQVLAGDTTVVRQSWKPGPSDLRGDVRGDVVWSQEKQDGWMTFRGLPELDPEKAYQLWIVDGDRKDSDPVDGGVFKLAEGDTRNGETLIPIRARLKIGKPAAFVITVEGKDGVVVSKQKHVVAIAGL